MIKSKSELTNEIAYLWKGDCTAYLASLMLQGDIGELKEVLMAEKAMRPRLLTKGTLLLEPGEEVREAHFLRNGLAALYSLDENGDKKVFFIWTAKCIVVLYKAFRERLPNEKFYIELLEDSEVVSVNSDFMDGVYAKHPTAHELTQKILSLKTERRIDQLDILLTDKADRYQMLMVKFPELFVNGHCRLPLDIIRGFIGISDSTRKRSLLDLDKKA